MINKDALRRCSIRKMVLQEDIPDLSDYERTDSRRSQSATDSHLSSFDSQSSKVGFWKHINTKDDEYKNAVIIKKWWKDPKYSFRKGEIEDEKIKK